jgi:hypothetical protein
MRYLEIPCRHFVQVAEVSCTHQELEGGNILLRLGNKRIIKVSNLYNLDYDHLKLFIIRTKTKIYLKMSIVIMTSYLIDKVV